MTTRLLAVGLVLLGVAEHSMGQGESAAIRAKTTVHGDGTRTETITNVDEKTMRATTYDASGKVLLKVLNRLNDDLEPVQAFYYDPTGKPLYRSVYKRDFNGRVTEVTDFSTTGKTLRRLVYSYDSVGKVMGIKAYDGNGNEIPSQRRKP
jgi:antitoxin component YwqK of YwqJK toxin-antitoxin module